MKDRSEPWTYLHNHTTYEAPVWTCCCYCSLRSCKRNRKGGRWCYSAVSPVWTSTTAKCSGECNIIHARASLESRSNRRARRGERGEEVARDGGEE
jgi:hypothetical protein